MGLIDSLSQTNDKAIDTGERYFKTSFEFYKLKAFQQLTISISLVFKALIIGGLACVCLLISATALALFIGKSITNYPLGFLMVGLLFFILSVVAYALKNQISNIIIKILSKKFFD